MYEINSVLSFKMEHICSLLVQAFWRCRRVYDWIYQILSGRCLGGLNVDRDENRHTCSSEELEHGEVVDSLAE